MNAKRTWWAIRKLSGTTKMTLFSCAENERHAKMKKVATSVNVPRDLVLMNKARRVWVR